MRFYRILFFIFVLFLACLSTGEVRALFIPPLPSSFFGTVKLNNANVPEGTLLKVLIDGKPVAETRTLMYQGDSVYAIDISGDDPETTIKDGGVEGEKIQFEVGGVLAKEVGTWKSGTNVELQLNLKSTELLNTPAATPIPAPTQTEIIPGYPTATVVSAAPGGKTGPQMPVPTLFLIGAVILVLIASIVWTVRRRKLF